MAVGYPGGRWLRAAGPDAGRRPSGRAIQAVSEVGLLVVLPATVQWQATIRPGLELGVAGHLGAAVAVTVATAAVAGTRGTVAGATAGEVRVGG